MPSVSIKTQAGADAGNLDLDGQVFGLEPNVPVMHQVVTAQLAARRAGTHSTKRRREVRGGGAKPWRQKGTGRARQGSIRAPHWRGGGVALGPKPRDYSQRTPKKMVRLALRSALSDRAAEGKVVVVDSWSFAAPKTKDAIAALDALMPVKLPPDLSKFLLCPMPGLVVSIAVDAGQEVKAGEVLAVVEAMKMENVLRAERDGVVSAVRAKAGDTLAVDAVILEFG